VPGQEKVAERQRRAFLHALASSDRRTLMCARTDQRAQRERLPSPWLLERASMLAGERVGGTDLYAERDVWSWLTVIPSFTAMVISDALFALDSFDELRSMTSWSQRAGATAEHPVAGEAHVRRALELVAARDSARLTRFDGLVGVHPMLTDALARPMTATKFESWATCPARYFYASVLDLFSREDDDQQLGLSGRARGTAVHDVLETFMKSVAKRERPGQPWTREERELLHTIGDRAFDDAVASGVSQAGLLHDIERRRLHDELERFLSDDLQMRLKYGVLPAGAEVEFGTDEVPPVVIERPARAGGGVRAPVRFRGRIDRLDRSPDGSRVVVTDYKTGKRDYLRLPRNDALAAGTKVQLAIYAEAVAEAGTHEVTSLYWATSDKAASDPFVELRYDDAIRERLHHVVDGVASGIESGLFAAVPGGEDRDSYKNCRMCAFDDICVADRDEAWDRKSSDPAATPWLSLDPAFDKAAGDE
jgi:RecB family exonuclease